MKLKVGITGGIGSGKSTVCKMFSELGIAVYDADKEAKNMMSSHREVKLPIIALFGENSYYKNGKLNRKHISELIFTDTSKRIALNKIVHPAVARDSASWHDRQPGPYTIKEAALMIESGSYKDMDIVILVIAPLELRISRVMKRDKLSRENVISRINAQMNDDQKKKYADYIIENDNLLDLQKRVLQIHTDLIHKNKSKKK